MRGFLLKWVKGECLEWSLKLLYVFHNTLYSSGVRQHRLELRAEHRRVVLHRLNHLQQITTPVRHVIGNVKQTTVVKVSVLLSLCAVDLLLYVEVGCLSLEQALLTFRHFTLGLHR